MLQQSAAPPDALENLCGQLPLDFQVQLTRFAQAENVTAAVQTAPDNTPAAAPSPNPPSTNGVNGEPHDPVRAGAPSTNGDDGASARNRRKKAPSPNGKKQRPAKPIGFDWLGELKRTFGGRART